MSPPARSDLRAVPALWPLRQRRNVVIACLEDPAPYEALRPRLAELEAELVVEREPGPLSAELGRPSVAVCDRYLDVVLHSERPPVEDVLAALTFVELSCPECPQESEELGG